MSVFDEVQLTLRERADLNARLTLIPYEGTPEIKDVNGKKYLYVRKRIGSKVTSTYVGAYSDELYQILLRSTREARAGTTGISGKRTISSCNSKHGLCQGKYEGKHL